MFSSLLSSYLGVGFLGRHLTFSETVTPFICHSSCTLYTPPENSGKLNGLALFIPLQLFSPGVSTNHDHYWVLMARPSSGGTELSESDVVSEGFGQLLKEEASTRAVGERPWQQLWIPSPGARSPEIACLHLPQEMAFYLHMVTSYAFTFSLHFTLEDPSLWSSL